MEFLYHLILGTLSKLLADIIHDVIKRKEPGLWPE